MSVSGYAQVVVGYEVSKSDFDRLQDAVGEEAEERLFQQDTPVWKTTARTYHEPEKRTRFILGTEILNTSRPYPSRENLDVADTPDVPALCGPLCEAMSKLAILPKHKHPRIFLIHDMD